VPISTVIEAIPAKQNSTIALPRRCILSRRVLRRIASS